MPCLALVATFGIIHHSGVGKVSADKRESATNTPQALPFSQNWTNVGLITANDDWSGVPGIVGFLGNYDAASPTNIDPRGLLAPFVTNDVDVIANQTNPDTLTNGGVAEFDTIANPVVALNGSGTADAPHIIIYVNTTGLGSIQFACNIRDIDASLDNSAQQVDVQYRVGGSGDYVSVPGGYVADASAGPTATMTTPLSLTLPAAANNQSQVEIRVMTTNAGGNDEWVGVDDISVTGSPAVAVDAPQDLNGDGKSDYVVVRNVGGGPTGQIRWFYNTTGTGAPTVALDWGLNGDLFVTEDFDGDLKDDVTVWRGTDVGGSKFYILQSLTNTVRIDTFGLPGDVAKVVGDYDGDGKADVAVYRPGAAAGQQSTWFYRGSLTPANINYVPWGQNGDFEAPGDYDGDGKNDFVIQRNAGGGQARFWRRFATGATDTVVFGTPTDNIAPGDYDGDGKTDLMVYRGIGGQINWFYLSSLNSSINQIVYGLSASDFSTQGDYDGDGKTDIGVWRPNADPTQNFFYSLNSSNGATIIFELGQNGDYPVANWNRH